MSTKMVLLKRGRPFGKSMALDRECMAKVSPSGGETDGYIAEFVEQPFCTKVRPSDAMTSSEAAIDDLLVRACTVARKERGTIDGFAHRESALPTQPPMPFRATRYP